jgi:AcrR family transcriptional regulator
MGRPRQFDEQHVLAATAAEFRVRGFADTSTERLCEVAGVGRGSLYNAFDSKEELFFRSFEVFVATSTAAQAECLRDVSRDGFGRLEALLEIVIAEEATAAVAGHAAGCMTVGLVMTPGYRERDPRIAALLESDLAVRLGLLADAVRIGQLDGSIRRDRDPLTAAWLVVTLISGVRVSAQSGAAPVMLARLGQDGLGSLAATGPAR